MSKITKFMKNIYLLIIAIVFINLTISCDQGLQPIEESKTASIKGKVYFISGVNSWPSADSLKDLRVAFFKSFPDSTNILNDFVTGNLKFTNNTLEYYKDSLDYEMLIEEIPTNFEYIAVVQNYGGILDWKVIGLYSENNDNLAPKKVQITESRVYDNININVDFNNIPKQPF